MNFSLIVILNSITHKKSCQLTLEIVQLNPIRKFDAKHMVYVKIYSISTFYVILTWFDHSLMVKIVIIVNNHLICATLNIYGQSFAMLLRIFYLDTPSLFYIYIFYNIKFYSKFMDNIVKKVFSLCFDNTCLNKC